MNNYSKEQISEITERVDKAIKLLGELNLGLSVQMSYTNLGNDSFGIKPIPFLQDTKYVRQEDGTFIEGIPSMDSSINPQIDENTEKTS